MDLDWIFDYKVKNKLVNRSILISPSGKIKCYYDKIHMYDAKLSTKEKYFESKLFKSGNKIKITKLPWGKLGLSICYDLRFPSMYKKRCQNLESFLLAFHQHLLKQLVKNIGIHLLKARAIENFSYVFAPGQAGKHCNGRKTYGHSLIVSPDGEYLKELGKKRRRHNYNNKSQFVKKT